MAEKDLLPLQNDRIFYGGQHIAVVVAETFEQAEYAASVVKVTYDQQPAIVGFEKNKSAAYKPPAGLGGAETQVKRGDAEAGMQTASVKTDETYTTPVFSHNAMEPHSSSGGMGR